MKHHFLVTLICFFSVPALSLANTLELEFGDVYDVSSLGAPYFGQVVGDYEITSVSVEAISQAHLPFFEKLVFWQACYNRSKNNPRTPFQKWIYEPFAVKIEVPAVVSGRVLSIEDPQVWLDDVQNQMASKVSSEGTADKCDFTHSIKVGVEVKSAQGNIYRTYSSINIFEGEDGSYYSESLVWDLSKYESEVRTQSLPNTGSPIDLYL